MSKKQNTNNPIQPNSFNGINAIKVQPIIQAISFLLGEVLTIVDASTEGDRNKAIKDLIRDKFSIKQDYFYQLANKDIAIIEPMSVDTAMLLDSVYPMNK